MSCINKRRRTKIERRVYAIAIMVAVLICVYLYIKSNKSGLSSTCNIPITIGHDNKIYATSIDSIAERNIEVNTDAISDDNNLSSYTYEPEYADQYEDNSYEISPSDFAISGVVYYNGWRWTWYSERVLPGGGLDIPGRYTDTDGFVCDGDGYICLSSSVLNRGAIINTPFGRVGKVYDTGCAIDTIDVYVGW